MPEPAQVVIVNATPIISLALIGKINLLQNLDSEVVIPPAVENDVLVAEGLRLASDCGC
jgi:predicted nucleic acid-binding protein